MNTHGPRRKFLQSAGLALPILSSTCKSATAQTESQSIRRLVCVGTYLGFHQPDFFPQQTGADYKMPDLLSPLEELRGQTTILSGLDHRGRNGHEGWKAWMTGSATGSVSMDQIVANKVGHRTRFSSLQLTCGNPPDDAKLSFTKEGVPLPMIGRPSVLYRHLFRSQTDSQRLEYLLSSNRSVLDDVLEEAKSVARGLSDSDQRQFDQYLSSLRAVERNLQKQQDWLAKPTPQVDYKLPEFDPVTPDLALECESIMYDLMSLALQTDSTRVITFLVPGWSQVFKIDGQMLSAGYHGLSHHGNDPQKIAQYNLIGKEHVNRFARFVRSLQSSKDADGRPLLDSTAIVFGSGMGDANVHQNSNLPTALVGGSFKHGSHHALISSKPNGFRLGDLYLSIMQGAGIDIQQFAGATRNLDQHLL